MTSKSVEVKMVFRRLSLDDIILPGDFHSLNDGLNLNPIRNDSTIGQTPRNFAKDRSFWRPTSIGESRTLTL